MNEKDKINILAWLRKRWRECGALSTAEFNLSPTSQNASFLEGKTAAFDEVRQYIEDGHYADRES